MSTITTPEVQNMAGCRCAEYGSAMNDEGPADNPAFFVDERLWDAAGGDDQLDALMAGSLLRALQDAATRAGVPFARITERRWSERGVPIAPSSRAGRAKMIEYRILRQQVSVLIGSAARRMADARSASS